MIPWRLLPIGLTALLCVDVKIDQSAYLDCLTDMFRAASRPGQFGQAPNPAVAPAPSVGIYNQAAIREMLGQSFGHSVIPARPSPPAPSRPLR